jgi:hypothetical protein
METERIGMRSTYMPKGWPYSKTTEIVDIAKYLQYLL